jgi:hypothetical protein
MGMGWLCSYPADFGQNSGLRVFLGLPMIYGETTAEVLAQHKGKVV